MATNIEYPGDLNLRVNGTFSARNISYPNGQITDAAVMANAGIDATKLIHQHAVRYAQAAGSDVASATVPIHTFRGAAEIVAVEVVAITAPTGGDKAFTVDVKLGNQSTAFASILSSVVTIDNTKANREVVAGTLAEDEAEDGDTLEVVVAASGATGSQGQGLLVTVWVREEP